MTMAASFINSHLSLKLTLFIFIIVLLTGCEDTIKFEEPQPANKANLKQIPKKLRGTYIEEADKLNLTIDSKAIVEWLDVSYKTTKDSLDFEIDSSKIVSQNNTKIQLNEGGLNLNLDFFSTDSIAVHYTYRDTIFSISDEHILRQFKGHYFLNYKRGEGNWKVRRLTLKNGNLSFAKVNLPDDITELKEITDLKEIEADSGKNMGYKLKPSKKELKQLMERSFTETKTYKKLK